MIRRIQPTEDDGLPLFGFLLSQARTAARVPIDEERATQNFWQTLSGGIVYVGEVDGRMVGTLAFSKRPFVWYGPPEIAAYYDDWFVVDPSHRGVGKALMRFAAEDPETEGVPLFIRRVRRTIKRGLVADILGFNVVGSVVSLR